MKIIKNKICITLAFLLYLILANHAYPMEIQISTSQNSYFETENIKITTIITNSSNEPVIMPLLFFPEDYYIRFIVKDINGKVARFIGLEFDWIESELDLLQMPPNAFYGQNISLNQHYELTPGVYTITAIYEVKQEARREDNVWIGRLISNDLNFSIAGE